MHLVELLAHRTVPAAAVYMAVTRRCTLGCRHCSTTSDPISPQLPAALLLRFARTFTSADHPEFMLLTGGEPLLRPGLVRSLAETARPAGTRTYVLTGAFFARTGRTPAPVRAALESVDHVAVSMDAFHEEGVPRHQVLRLLGELLDAGRAVSVQACGSGPGDPYLAGLTADLRREFGERVPMLVTILRPAGRSLDWPEPPGAPSPGPVPGGTPRAAPCDLVAWPVIGFDGTIVACCNGDVIDSGPAAGHLRVGHVSSETWPQVRDAVVSSPVLRWLRTRGPVQLAERGAPGAAAGGYCAACRSLAGRHDLLADLGKETSRPAFGLIEQQASVMQLAAGPVAFARRHGDPTRAELVLAGYPGRPLP
jgi:hypothetical protein